MARGERDNTKERNAVTEVMSGRLRPFYPDDGPKSWRTHTGGSGPESVDGINLNAELLPPRKRKPEGE